MAIVFVPGSSSVGSTSSTAFFSSINVGYNFVAFTATFVNNSSTNTHTWSISGTNGIGQSAGTFGQGTINRNRNFVVGESQSGSVLIEKFGPAGGLLGSASFTWTTGFSYDDTPSPPPPPATPAPVFSDEAVSSPAIRGQSYTDKVTANNTNSYSVIAGRGTTTPLLPAGITLNTSTGDITGTPTTTGTSSFIIRATGNGGTKDTPLLTIVVNNPAPVFSDQAITTSWIKTRNFDAAPDRTVVASDVESYSVVYSGSGLNPTSWLTINSSGQLSGLPPALGVYTFAIRATNVTCSTDSTLKTLTINPPGNRRDATNFQTDMILTKRYTGTQWVNVTTFKRYNGTAWVDIVN